MELRQLRYFVAVAEELHFGRAAGRLGIAQPALSQQIRKLETDLGVELLTRNRRRVALSPAGAAFLPEARETVARAARAARVARRTAAGELGRLALGFVGSATDELLPRAMPVLRARYPDLEVTLRESTSAEQVAALARGELDLGLLRPPSPLPAGLRTRLLTRERLVAALPVGHRLTRLPRLTAADLRGEPLVRFPRAEGAWMYDLITDYCRGDGGPPPEVAQEAVMMQTITALVAAGTGIALVPASQRTLARPGVAFRRLVAAPLLDLVAAWPESCSSPARGPVVETLAAAGGSRGA
ncbi:LysR substrate-binding domain-containing protein [Streptomyces sp. NBC_01808]|uniref:LysR substrate-binding domain-containing protein n=1 Tax=Streptomyces sp. NBC_01808 TaxID=2975947 RepID=UPI002DDBF68B|nr:LysR substrate-binding domain-containing protein [Streptomyces sp. NBC_01808]WSA36532.1 LysR substrate-binding domain-containing protein [Streptomyces sp. NBC_01808]